MSNKPNFSNIVSLSEFRTRREEEASIHVDLGDGGDPLVIPPPERWPDDLPSFTRKPVEAIKAIVGDDEWKRWVAVGGTAKELNQLFAIITQDRQGVTAGES